MGGSREGAGGPDPLSQENHKWLKVSLEILVQTPLKKQLDPRGAKKRNLLSNFWTADVAKASMSSSQLIFDNTIIFAKDHKHLGITFSSNGQWHTHIENIANVAAKILGTMRKLKYTLCRNAFISCTTHYRVRIISVGWLHTTRFQYFTKDTRRSGPYCNWANQISIIS